jgi:ABC-type lipoprotein release transport system permease subunit
MITSQMAWRNIWRNKRRTLITVSSIAFAVLFASVMQSLEEGSWENIIDNVIGSYTGNIQVHKKGYWDSPSINDLILLDSSLLNLPGSNPGITDVVPRLESGALVSTGQKTRGAFIMAISPEAENKMSQMSARVVQGQYLQNDDDGVLIGDDMARILNTAIGDTIILISQGYHGANAAGKYPLRGLVHFPSPQLNRSVIIMDIHNAQAFYGAPDRVSAMIVRLDKLGKEQVHANSIRRQMDTAAFEIMTYKELLPELMKSKQLDTSGNYIIYSILYLIIAFGVFGTVLMMLKERQFEFGVLLSIGMHRRQLFFMVWRELLCLGLLGTAVGLVISYCIAFYLKLNPIQLTGDFADAMEKFEFEPILPATTTPGLFITQAIIVLIICLIISIYPLFHLSRLQPVDAMRE